MGSIFLDPLWCHRDELGLGPKLTDGPGSGIRQPGLDAIHKICQCIHHGSFVLNHG